MKTGISRVILLVLILLVHIDVAGQQAFEVLPLQISKVFYSTAWFKLLLLLLLVVLIAWYVVLWRKRELKRSFNQAIAYFANSLHGKNKVDEILWDITHNVITRTNLVDCVIYLVDDQKRVLVQKAAFGDKNPGSYEIINPIDIPLGRGIVGSVALTGKAELINDTSKDSRYIADDASRLSELSVPILYEGKVIGVIDSEHPQKNFYNQEHLELMKTIASISGTKIIKAQREVEAAEGRKRIEDLKVQVADSRQQALRSQMNPHFIFNCLNSINGFILQNDAATASSFLIKFSKLIRLILEHSNERFITLHSELEALKIYIEMEMLRFDRKFSYELVTGNVMLESIMVPPLIFQPFVENSIWHGLLHKETMGKLHIHLSCENDLLKCVIEDNGIGRDKSAELKSELQTHKKSLGMQLTKERLALMNEQENRKSSLEVSDLYDKEGNAAGTRVVITIECNTEEQ